ncbi:MULTISPECIES: phytoene/squalene synthase family protein [unclassified Novosphingobium]|uniref:phytoene/squalene synthase family protein n=1 Tax=unclassified Novosphingobium TaxID=2644732 RepID=UPI000868541F|nr:MULTISPECIES: phytoene/squalene synthase family protein [unclassified Novosphingobium]MBN9145217.1 phytoene/squalene synthase family protein [Novosphingobium sp.]MDR6709595.1 phytoene synthase [Novosphingobium sp. 1748]ODU81341.1 MAG: phytoene synthase [Novosphingobium sp. SCN 63-17]OJX88669.1 MAG: phytoene synthase [Novosphingobium sp. 63-713]
MSLDRGALVEAARESIARGSKSFAAASKLFDAATRERVWLLYAWCRACDDLADDQDHGGALGAQAGAAERLEQIRRLTARALGGDATGHFAFDALGVVAAECGINAVHTGDVIAGFALDAAGWRPRTELDMLGYCYHVAGAVGVLMALVMGVDPEDGDTLNRASDLGIAFQLGNIARDIAEDHAAGRCYLPADWLAQAGVDEGELMAPRNREALAAMVARMCATAQLYEASARAGAARLPFRCRWAVLSAAGIYGAIARKVAARGPRAWESRVSTSGFEKLRFLGGGLIGAMAGAPEQVPLVPYRRGELAQAVARV